MKTPDTFNRPGISVLFIVFALVASAAFVLDVMDGKISAELLGAAAALFAVAEVLNYLARIAWQLEQNSAPKEPAAAPEIPPAESFDAKVERHRAELRTQHGLK